MKSISITDLALIPELGKYNYMELIHPDQDDLMAKYLEMIGFDIEYPIQYIPSQHRNMQGKKVINYVVVGEVSCNRKHLNSEWADITDRIIANSYTDRGLAEDMLSLQCPSLDYSAFHEGKEDTETTKEDIGSYFDREEEKRIVAQIKQLEELRDSIRGSMFNKDGSAKTFADYKKGGE